MREALGALPWVKHVQLDYAKKQATVTVEPEKLDENALIQALQQKGFGGTVLK